MGDRSGFGQPVALHDLAAGEPLEPLEHVDRQRRGPGEEGLDRTEVVALEIARLVEQDVDPRRAGKEPWTVLLDREEDVAKVGPRDQDHRHGAKDREVHHDGEPVHVEERHDRENAIAFADRRVPRAALMDVRDECAVRQHRPFRRAGGPAGVLEDGKVGRRDRDRPDRRVALEHVAQPHRPAVAAYVDAVTFLALACEGKEQPQRKREVLLDVGHDDVPHVGPRGGFGDQRIEAREHHHHARSGIDQLRAQLAHGVERVRRDHDRSSLQRAEEAVRELGAVR